MIRSHFEYVQTVWSPYRVKMIDEVAKVQKRATKIVPGLRHVLYIQPLQKLQLPTLVYWTARMIWTLEGSSSDSNQKSRSGTIPASNALLR